MARKFVLGLVLAGFLWGPCHSFTAAPALAAATEINANFSLQPPFLTSASPPLLMLVMSKDHKQFYKAYTDYSDLDADGDLETTYKHAIDYYGYFDCEKCYAYQNSRFEPVGNATDKKCSQDGQWSGNFLNWATMARIDVLRKVLYGGYRSTDQDGLTVLERTFLPQDAHSWVKIYSPGGGDPAITEVTGLTSTDLGGATTISICNTTKDSYGNPPLMRVAKGGQTGEVGWPRWSSNERWQCACDGEGKSGYNTLRPHQTNDLLGDYYVRVKVCDPNWIGSERCEEYPNGNLKPVGLLQAYGEEDQMYFGLLTGSYTKNKSGGVLRKNISSITNEVTSNSGIFTGSAGIIDTLNRIKIARYSYSDGTYNNIDSCSWGKSSFSEGECTNWGNPISEMYYEALRYFAGKASPTGAFSTDDSSIQLGSSTLGLGQVTWQDPYDTYEYCYKPFIMVISDLSPSFDSDQLPGSYFDSFSGDISGLDVETETSTIGDLENLTGSYFIGQSGATHDETCGAKSVTENLGQLRGLCPEEPGRQGSYGLGGLAYWAKTNDLRPNVQEDQNVETYSIGLSTPLPELELEVGDSTVKVIPSCWDNATGCPCALVQFRIIQQTDTAGAFYVNWEDSEQGGDYDMDADCILYYEISGNQVTFKVAVTNSSTGYDLDLGYVVSGTTEDGVHLIASNNGNWFSNRTCSDSETCNDGDSTGDFTDCANDYWCGEKTHTVGDSTASHLKNPLWYAAKWGGFKDQNSDALGPNDRNTPDLEDEWKGDGDDPKNYFYVTNPLHLEQQLNRAFLAVLERASAGTAASVISSTRSGEGAVYQAIFFPKYENIVDWVGEVHALLVDAYGNMREDTDQDRTLDLSDKIIQFDETESGVIYKWEDTNTDGILSDSERSSQSPVGQSFEDVEWLWSASTWLNSISDANIVSQRTTYISTNSNRYIFTFIDDGDMVAESGEQKAFTTANWSSIEDYLHLFEPFTAQPGGFVEQTEAENQINFIRGKDQSGMRNRTYDSDDDGNLDTTWRLGDIVHSTPTTVATPAEDYDLLYTDTSYKDFFVQYRNRRTMIYVGANDGMFHAFNGGFFNPSENKFYKGYDADDSDGDGNPYTDSGVELDGPDLGAELWAYVPFNLLPHLYWLTDADYSHTYYCDLKPRVFDAKIFPDDAAHPDGWGTVLVGGMRFGGGNIRTDKDHDGTYDPNTDLVMKSAYFILDITDPESPPEVLGEVAFDGLGFTTGFPGVLLVKAEAADNPNNWYLVLGSGPDGAKLSFAGPGGFAAGDRIIGNDSGTTAVVAAEDAANNVLYVGNVVGSFDDEGAPGERLCLDANANGTCDAGELTDTKVQLTNTIHGVSSQSAQLYMINLNRLVQNSLEDPNTDNPITQGAFMTLDSNSYVADQVSVDLNLDYKADALYFGTTSGYPGNWGGKMRRIVLHDPVTPATWSPSTLIETTFSGTGQPLTAPPALAMDRMRRIWVFFGTGRFLDRGDVTNDDQQTYYGIKEPLVANWDTDGIASLDELTWADEPSLDLLDVSDIVVFENGSVKCEASFGDPSPGACAHISETDDPADGIDYGDLQAAVEAKNGWKLHFPRTRERNLGQAALLGEILTFTSYVPDDQECHYEGDSYLYAVDFSTGTALPETVIGYGERTILEDEETYKEVKRGESLGKGLALTPNIHTGRERGSKAFVQTSTGAIVVIEQENPGATKSGKAYWKEMEE
jgi:type IV pilus assembly protein PilY1